MFNFLKKIKEEKGFSLIELIVVVAIITLLTSATLFSHSRFSGGVTLESLAYEIALTVRQAQFFGINVRNVGGVFDAGYGVYFDKNNPTSFILFADTNDDRFYSGPSEIIEVYTITRGNQIKYLCVDSECVNPEVSIVEGLQITFVRPEPDAVIKTTNTTLCGAGTSLECGLAEIHIGSPKENTPDKIISVGVTGFISVN